MPYRQKIWQTHQRITGPKTLPFSIPADLSFYLVSTFSCMSGTWNLLSVWYDSKSSYLVCGSSYSLIRNHLCQTLQKVWVTSRTLHHGTCVLTKYYKIAFYMYLRLNIKRRLISSFSSYINAFFRFKFSYFSFPNTNRVQF